MWSIVAIPKAFKGEAKINQENAIKSWTLLPFNPQIVLCGNDPGVKEYAQDHNLRYYPYLKYSEGGAPLLDSVFNSLEAITGITQNVLFINSDIILLQDFRNAILTSFTRRCIQIGQRRDLEVALPIPVGGDNWSPFLGHIVHSKGVLHGPSGLDFFFFPSDLDWKMPSFALGRTAWDNWIPYRAKQLGLDIMDVTKEVTVVHPVHGYNHLPQGANQAWKGYDAEKNQILLGPRSHAFTTDHSDYVLTKKGFKRTVIHRRLFFGLKKWIALHPRFEFLATIVDSVLKKAGRV